MADKYVKLDDVIDTLEYEWGYKGIREELQNLPAADVTEVKHGKWEICCDGYYPYCSVCKAEPKNGVMSNYCPECGAKMNGG